MKKNDPAYLELLFRPNVDLVSIVRRFITEFYDLFFIDPEASSRLALTTHELLENAVKYSTTGETRLRVEVTRGTTPCKVSIQTWNDATAEDIATLKQMFADLSAAPDVFEHYQEQMRRTVQHDEGSRLGLVRIRAEADMTVHLEATGSMVCLTAETHAELKEGR